MARLAIYLEQKKWNNSRFRKEKKEKKQVLWVAAMQSI
jgi:hypothetical protein